MSASAVLSAAVVVAPVLEKAHVEVREVAVATPSAVEA